MGRLTGKYSTANPTPGGRKFSDVNMNELEPLLEAMRRIAENRNVSVSSIALNYVICKGQKMLFLSKNKFESCLFCSLNLITQDPYR